MNRKSERIPRSLLLGASIVSAFFLFFHDVADIIKGEQEKARRNFCLTQHVLIPTQSATVGNGSPIKGEEWLFKSAPWRWLLATILEVSGWGRFKKIFESMRQDQQL